MYVQPGRFLTLVYVGLLLGAATPAWAEPPRDAVSAATLEDAKALSRRAITAYNADDFATAAPLFEQAWQALRRLEGASHRETLTAMGNYARTLEAMTRYQEAEPVFRDLVMLTRTSFGAGAAETLAALRDHANVLAQLGQHSQAAGLLREYLPLARRALGEDHVDVTEAIGTLAVNLDQSGETPDAEGLFADYLDRKRRAPGTEPAELFDAVSLHAFALQKTGRANAAAARFLEALEIARGVFGDGSDRLAQARVVAGDALLAAGRQAEAEQQFREATTIYRSLKGDRDPVTIKSGTRLANALQDLGRLDEAEPIYRAVLDDAEHAPAPDDALILLARANHATVLGSLGRYEQAIPLSEAVLKALVAKHGERSDETLRARANHAALLDSAGDGPGAVREAAQVLELRTAISGTSDPRTAAAMAAYANAIGRIGRHAEAALLLRKAAEIMGKSGLDQQPRLVTILNNAAVQASAAGAQEVAADDLAAALRQSKAVFGSAHPETIVTMANYSRALAGIDREQEALPLITEASKAADAVYGPDHETTLTLQMMRGQVLWLNGDLTGAQAVLSGLLDRLDRLNRGESQLAGEVARELALLRISLPTLMKDAVGPARRAFEIRQKLTANGELAMPAPPLVSAASDASTAELARLFASAAWAGRQNDTVPADVFSALQTSLQGSTNRAISRNAALRLADRRGLGGLARRRDDLLAQITALDTAVIDSYARSDEHAEQRRTAMSRSAAQARTSLAEIDRQLHSEAPEYFAVIQPASLTPDQAMAMLGPDEAALVLVPGAFGSHTLLVTREGLRWHRADVKRGEIEDAVQRLMWQVGGNVSPSVEQLDRWEAEDQGEMPFGLNTAHWLYRTLIAPVADGLKGKRQLFVAATGALSSLPLGILVTAPPEPGPADPRRLRQAKWFADEIAISVVPSLQALDFIRRFRPAARHNRALRPFLGFGDPALGGLAATRGGIGGSARRGGGGERFPGIAAIYAGGVTRSGDALASIDKLRLLSRIPGTRDEIEAQRQALRAPTSAVRLGAAATETSVRRSPLAAQVITFATHGLLAGEAGGFQEPGLVFTPPALATLEDDGYLSASEITLLSIDADWLILSACNTAAGDGSAGAPGLSGLARSFFYAGATNLLASHWPVRDDVAAKLTVRTIEIKRDNPAISRTAALQQAMRELRGNPAADSFNDSWAHPAAWAPFSFVGDGAR